MTAYYALVLREFKQTLNPTLFFCLFLLRKTSSSDILKDEYGTDPRIEHCAVIISFLHFPEKLSGLSVKGTEGGPPISAKGFLEK